MLGEREHQLHARVHGMGKKKRKLYQGSRERASERSKRRRKKEEIKGVVGVWHHDGWWIGAERGDRMGCAPEGRKGWKKGVGRCSLFFCFVAPAFGADSHSRCIGPISPGRRRACSTAPSQRRSAGKSTPGERVGERRRRKNRTALSFSASVYTYIYMDAAQKKKEKKWNLREGAQLMVTGRRGVAPPRAFPPLAGFSQSNPSRSCRSAANDCCICAPGRFMAFRYRHRCAGERERSAERAPPANGGPPGWGWWSRRSPPPPHLEKRCRKKLLSLSRSVQ